MLGFCTIKALFLYTHPLSLSLSLSLWLVFVCVLDIQQCLCVELAGVELAGVELAGVVGMVESLISVQSVKPSKPINCSAVSMPV